MTEKSYFWTTDGTGDGALPYTQGELFRIFRSWFIGRNINGRGGVFQSPVTNASLEITGTASPLAIGPGNAMVDGIPYKNTDTTYLAVTTPSGGDTGHCVVLRADWAAQTVRVALVSSPDGDSSEPALTQTSDDTYEIKLAYIVITTGGVITVTDRREFLFFNSLWHLHQGGSKTDWTSPGSSANAFRTPTLSQGGAVNWTGSATSGSVTVTFPEEFYTGTVPMGFVQVLTKTGITTRFVGVDNTQATIYWESAGSETDLDFQWIAFGLMGSES